MPGTLLDISAYCRNRILSLCLLEDAPIVVDPWNCEAPGLLRTCTQLRAEAKKIFYKGNIFRLHMKGFWALSLGRLMLEAGFSNNVHLLKAHSTRVPFVRLRYLDTWQGRSIRPAEAVKKCQSLGLEALDLQDEWTTMMWVGGRKK